MRRQNVIVVAGVSHHETPLDARQKFSVSIDRIGSFLSRVRACPFVTEACVLSTCNRVELILVVEATARDSSEVIRREDIESGIAHVLSEWSGIGVPQVSSWMYAHYGQDAVRHLFRVASGLDSLVLGEPQILGQLKNSYEYARAHGKCGVVLNHLLQSTFHVAKQVRSQTGIGRRSVSVCSAAKIMLTNWLLNDASEVGMETVRVPPYVAGGYSVLLLGAGEMGRLMGRHLVAGGARADDCYGREVSFQVCVASRTHEHALTLANELGVEALSLSEALHEVSNFDVVISTLGIGTDDAYILKSETLSGNPSRSPKILVDLGVPRTIDPVVATIFGAHLIAIDNLREMVDENLAQRRMEQRRAEVLIQKQSEAFGVWLERRLQARPLHRFLAGIHAHEQDAVSQTLRKILPQMNTPLGPEDLELLEQALQRMVRSLTKRVLHLPLSAIQASQPEERAKRLDEERFGEFLRVFQLPLEDRAAPVLDLVHHADTPRMEQRKSSGAVRLSRLR